MKVKNRIKKIQTWVTIGLIFIASFVLTYVVSYWTATWRMDFTQEKIYTLSEGSKKILASVNAPITLKLFYSKTAAGKGTEGVRQLNNYFEYVRDLLVEMTEISKHKIDLQIVDPRPDTDDEEEATMLGLKKFPITESENYFFGLVAKGAVGQERVIEFFDPGQQQNVEYQLVKTIYTLMHPRKKKMGVISDVGFNSDGLSPFIIEISSRMHRRPTGKSWIINDILKDFYDISRVEFDAEKIENIDVLLVVHPENLSDRILFNIDQYLMKGGKMILLVDPQMVTDREPRGDRSSSNLKKLMDTWGVEFNTDQFAGDLNLAGLARTEQFSPLSRMIPLLQCDDRCFRGAQNDVVVSGLKNLVFVFPGHFTLKDKSLEGKSFIPLIQTTDEGNTYEVKAKDFQKPVEITEKFHPGNKAQVIAYKFSGALKSSFPSGVDFEVEEAAKEKDAPPIKIKKHLDGLLETIADPTIFMVGDVDFINDPFAFQQTPAGLGPLNDNALFFVNTIENMTGNVDLMSIRAKGRIIRGFDRIDEIEREAQKKSAGKIQEIQRNIDMTQTQLSQLAQRANDQNVGLLAQEGLQKRREMNKKLIGFKKELREVKREGREKIERIGNILQYVDVFLIPFLLLLWGAWVFLERRTLLRQRIWMNTDLKERRNV